MRDDRLRMLSFTGSATVGWHLKQIAGKKRVMLELGGNGGVVVDETADFELAARRCARGRFVFAGQYCIAVQRILVQRACYERSSTCSWTRSTASGSAIRSTSTPMWVQ